MGCVLRKDRAQLRRWQLQVFHPVFRATPKKRGCGVRGQVDWSGRPVSQALPLPRGARAGAPASQGGVDRGLTVPQGIDGGKWGEKRGLDAWVSSQEQRRAGRRGQPLPVRRAGAPRIAGEGPPCSPHR